MPIPISVVDAFTDRPFAGNPAGVCLLDADRPAEWQQSVARELNLSETAFLLRRPDGDWSLRWFTPADEERLCGHATLAAAHRIWTLGLATPDTMLRFHTLSGLLTAERRGAEIVLDFPSEPPAPIATPAGLAEALGARIFATGQNRLDIFAELEHEAAVRALAPAVEKLVAYRSRGVVVTARAEPGKPYDFVSRFFAPNCGIPEDPVTGSAHCGLAPWWAPKLGKTEMVGYQASPRGGTVGVTLRGDRCLLAGTAVTVWTGELL